MIRNGLELLGGKGQQFWDVVKGRLIGPRLRAAAPPSRVSVCDD